MSVRLYWEQRARRVIYISNIYSNFLKLSISEFGLNLVCQNIHCLNNSLVYMYLFCKKKKKHLNQNWNKNATGLKMSFAFNKYIFPGNFYEMTYGSFL